MVFNEKEYLKKYNQRQDQKDKRKAYAQKAENKEKMRKYLKTYRVAYEQKPETKAMRKDYNKRPEVAKKAYARCLAARAKIPVLECIRCGSKELLQRHHLDYDKPLEVVILCHQCHVDEHKTLKTLAPSI